MVIAFFDLLIKENL